MKISDKEKTMLCVLGSIVVGFLYYQFLYLSQSNEIEEKSKTESEIQQKYNTTMNTINSMESKKSDVKILKSKINDESLPFYPTISEEHIILELDNLLKDSGLKGSITFQPIVSDSVENSKKEVKSLAESSLQGVVDNYNSSFKDTEKTQQSTDKIVDNATKSQTNDKDSNNTNTINASNPNTTDASNKKDTKKNTVQYLKFVISFDGSYDGIYKLLNTIGTNEKKIIVNSINLSSGTLGVKGTINLEIYSVPKINDELESYLKWDLANPYGKSVPFSIEAASGNMQTNKGYSDSTNTEPTKSTNTEPSDFIASVKSINSDLPTIMLGRANDKLRTTYVYADSDSEENVEIILTQDGEKYYYKYKTSKGTFPANYNDLGAEFVPASKDIVLEMISIKRLTANDNSAIKLKLVNKTDKVLEVNISGDDLNNPRVTIDSDGNNISVNKK